MYQIHCDRPICQTKDNVKSGTSLPEGWNKITIDARGFVAKILILCPGCNKDLGLEKETQQPGIEDRLYDIATEILEEAEANR